MALIGIIAVWAIIIMNKKFNIASEVISGAKLIRKGPYKIIRHPMYLSVFLVTLCWLIDYFTYTRLIATLILYFAMILKINHEEKLLKSAFPEYEEYQSQTKRIIPYVY
jgi:protein-S-isoprenylcysteine O-methyltransferase Ste14